MALTVGSLFAGIGGFDLGFERAGMVTRWQVEQDEFCRKVLARHFPHADRYEDVRHVHGLSTCPIFGGCGDDLEPVDVICGGVPCQPVSIAGQGLGEDDERWLWPDTLRIISELRPRYAVLENPAIFLRRGAAGVLGALSEIGYDAEWEVISACAFGAPHMRRRVFIIAYPEGERCDGRGTAEQAAQPVEPSGLDTGAPWRGWQEPRPVGVADGIPDRMDRLKACGNALVPDVAEWIGWRIIQREEPCRQLHPAT